MISVDYAARTARALEAHGLSLPEHYVMIPAGYRANLQPDAFIKDALMCSRGDRRGEASLAELTAALDHLLARRLLTCLTEVDLREEALRRAASAIPEIFDIGYDVGDVDFTPHGYTVHRAVIRAIFGEDFLATSDTGVNLDVAACRFDVYGVRADECRSRMERMAQSVCDHYTGLDGTRFVGWEWPTAIGPWRPNRFFVRDAGYHGVLHFRWDTSEHAA